MPRVVGSFPLMMNLGKHLDISLSKVGVRRFIQNGESIECHVAESRAFEHDENTESHEQVSIDLVFLYRDHANLLERCKKGSDQERKLTWSERNRNKPPSRSIPNVTIRQGST